jgi:hypothetical protein
MLPADIVIAVAPRLDTHAHTERCFWRPVVLACRDNAALDTTERLSRFSAAVVARVRLLEVLVSPPDAALSRSVIALWRVSSETVPFFGG